MAVLVSLLVLHFIFTKFFNVDTQYKVKNSQKVLGRLMRNL